MVLGRRQGDDRLAIGDRQHAHFLAVEPLLDHQPVAGGAEDLLPRDLFYRLDGLSRGRRRRPRPFRPPGRRP